MSDGAPKFSVRGGSDFAQLTLNVTTEPHLLGAVIIGNRLVCRVESTNSTDLQLHDARTGAKVEHFRLPRLRALHASHGWSLGELKKLPDSQDGVVLCFLDPAYKLVSLVELNEAIAGVASGRGRWFVLCRSGRVLCLSHHGAIIWTWLDDEIVNAATSQSEPQALRLIANDDFIALSHARSVHGLSHYGHTLWRCNDLTSSLGVTMPLGESKPNSVPWRELGLEPGASNDEVKRAYRRLALISHPDRSGDDVSASLRFSKLHSAYETLMSSHSGALAYEASSRQAKQRATVASLFALKHRIVVVPSEGHLSYLDLHGSLSASALRVGHHLLPVITRSGNLVAIACDDMLSFLDGDRVVNTVPLPDRPVRVVPWGRQVLVVYATSMDAYDPTGDIVWSVEFRQMLSSVSTSGDRVACTAGSAMIFQSSKRRSSAW